MEDYKINEESFKYAESKLHELITKSIADAFSDGYRKGYEDGVNSTKFIDNSFHFVDLGLPSGTLWPSDFLKDNEQLIKMPFCKTSKYNLPTAEQWKELKTYCFFSSEKVKNGNDYLLTSVTITGPNGNKITYDIQGLKLKAEGFKGIIFWLSQGYDIEPQKLVAVFTNQVKRFSFGNENCTNLEVSTIHSGQELPIIIVKK